MARIFHSPNPDFKEVADLPSQNTNYVHPVATHRNHPIPMAFQITSPFNRFKVLMPHALVMHVNPNNIQETHTQKVERFQTRGGWQEQHWGQELSEVAAEGSTGAFMNIYTGLCSVIRQRTIAWDRYRDLHDLYMNNGSVYDPFGNIVLQGHVLLLYDRGVYIGTFRSFEMEETADSPFAFNLNWNFKIEHTISTIHFSVSDAMVQAQGWQGALAPTFQSQNLPTNKDAINPDPPTSTEEADQKAIAEKAAEDRRYDIARKKAQELDQADPARLYLSPEELEARDRDNGLDLNINRLYNR